MIDGFAFSCFLIITVSFSLLFQFTRSHRGEKDKVNDSASDADEGNLSLMNRTKRQAKAAREQQQQLAFDVPLDGGVQDLEEMVLQTRDRVKAAKAARSRAASLRRELQELQDEEQSIAEEADPTPTPFPSTDPGALVAATLKSAVFIIFIYIPSSLI